MLEYGIVLLVEADVKEITSALDVFRNQFVGVLVSAGVAVFFISISLGRRIARPVTKLSYFANQLANENFDAELDLKDKDEIGQLGANMRDMRIALKKAKKHKDEFAAMISHELKTPLTPIKIYATALKKPKFLGEINQKQAEALDGIHFNAERLERLIGDLLVAQTLATGRMKFIKEKFSVNEILDDAVKDYQMMTKETNIQITSKIDEEIYIYSDKKRIEQVLDNLNRNSIDFVHKDTGTIQILAEKNNDDVLFTVKDNGKGILKKVQKKLFTRFYQADTSITRRHGGTGLGLVICKGIVKGLGGKIWLESTLGKGTNVYFTIPKGESQ